MFLFSLPQKLLGASNIQHIYSRNTYTYMRGIWIIFTTLLINKTVWKDTDTLFVHYLWEKLSRVCSEHDTHSQHGLHVSNVQCSSDIQAPTMCAATKSMSTAALVVWIQFLKSLRSATGVWYTQSFTYPHRKKSQGVISNELAGQEMGPTCPLHWFQRCRLIDARTSKVQCSGAPSYWKNTACCSSCTCGQTKFSSISK